MVINYFVNSKQWNHVTRNIPVSCHPFRSSRSVGSIKRSPFVRLHAYLSMPNVVKLSHLHIRYGSVECQMHFIMFCCPWNVRRKWNPCHRFQYIRLGDISTVSFMESSQTFDWILAAYYGSCSFVVIRMRCCRYVNVFLSMIFFSVS